MTLQTPPLSLPARLPLSLAARLPLSLTARPRLTCEPTRQSIKLASPPSSTTDFASPPQV
jgi:hypothetical protein